MRVITVTVSVIIAVALMEAVTAHPPVRERESQWGIPPDAFDFSTAGIYDSPTALASWNASTALTMVDLRADGVAFTFSKQSGPDRWPDVTPPGFGGPIQYTIGMAYNIDGNYAASAPIIFWYGLEVNGGPIYEPGQLPNNWFYDSRWGPMQGYQPALGETVYMFACAGDCRGFTDGSQSPVQERTNVVAFAFPNEPTTFYFPDSA